MSRARLPVLAALASSLLAAGCQNMPSAPPDPGLAAGVATIEGLAQVGIFFSPNAMLQYPGLVDFRVLEIDGDSRKKFSEADFTLPPGRHTLTFKTQCQYRPGMTGILEFNAEAGKTYLLRPLYTASKAGALLADKATGKIVARCPSEKPAATYTVAPGAAQSSTAGDVLFHDTLQAIAATEASENQTTEFVLTRVKHERGRSLDDIKRGVDPGRYTLERWYLFCDNSREPEYKVLFNPAKDGGTDFVVTRDD
jgi:hypothetical protein